MPKFTIGVFDRQLPISPEDIRCRRMCHPSVVGIASEIPEVFDRRQDADAAAELIAEMVPETAVVRVYSDYCLVWVWEREIRGKIRETTAGTSPGVVAG